jgi:putative ABC transport system permease protein
MNLGNQLQGLRGDLRIAVRSLRHSPGFAATTILSLSLGVALTASTLSVMNGYLVRAMPFAHSERLYRVLYDSAGHPEPRGLERVDWTSLSDVVEVADYSSLGRFILHSGNYPQEISSLQCAPGALDAIGVRAALGRAFSADDFRPGSERVILISDALWRERFGVSPTVLGKTIRVSAANSGEPPTEYRVIGVLPPGFRYVGNDRFDPADTALPLTAPRAAYMVRLRDGVPTTVAAQQISEGVRSVASEIPAGWQGVRLESVHAHYVRDVRPILIGVTVAAALVLLIDVTNVAVLMLLRALRRQKEMAVRAALGAGPHRIARLLFAETALLCSVAIAAGIALTAITLRALGPQIEARLRRPVPGGVSALAVDGSVLLWIGAIGLLTVVIVTWVPMLGVRPTRLADSLRSEGRSGTDRPTVRRTRAALIVVEVAASTALLIGGGLMLRSVAHLVGTPLGYETNQVFRPRIQLPNGKYRDAVSFTRFYDRLEQQLAAVPNLAFAVSTFVPFWEPPTQAVETDRGDTMLRASVTSVGPDYFRTLGVGLREGRAFTPADRAGAEPVVVISESLARALTPHGTALGTRIRMRESSDTGEPRWIRRTVVGVTQDVHQTHEDGDLKDTYVPFAQAPSRFASVYIRAAGSSQQWLETLRTVVASIDPDVFVGPAPPLSVQVDTILAGPRFVTALLTAFALFAALLALLGIYGVTGYAAQQREREIAIRIAIGATAGSVVSMFLRDSGRVLVIGIVGGVFGGTAVSRILQSQLHGVEPFDPWTIAVTCVFLVTAGLFATWVPTRRVTHTDPMTTLRSE